MWHVIWVQVLKRLHSTPDKRERKDACKPHGRLLSKIAATNPLPVLETIVPMVGGVSPCCSLAATCRCHERHSPPVCCTTGSRLAVCACFACR